MTSLPPTVSTMAVPARRWAPPWWRALLPKEQAFVHAFFGEVQGAWLCTHVRLGQRRLGDTRRALCLHGGWLSLPKALFESRCWQQPLHLAHPAVAGIFAHELLHALQRQQGMAVTRQALWLQLRWCFGGQDPYAYGCPGSARALLRQFWHANVEQQGQMWQDCVQAQVAGVPLASHALLALAVRRAKLRPGASWRNRG